MFFLLSSTSSSLSNANYQIILQLPAQVKGTCPIQDQFFVEPPVQVSTQNHALALLAQSLLQPVNFQHYFFSFQVLKQRIVFYLNRLAVQ